MATIESFVPILDLGGTFVFAISGAVAAVNRRLDIFGILVLSFVTGNLGGITRDVLIGAVPPAALTDSRYLLVSVLAGLITFFWYAGVNRLRTPVLMFDAAGLSFFAVAGTQKAIEFGLSPVASALLGMLTGIGGGMMRDVLLAEIPQVLRSDLYAVAALAGALIVVIGNVLGLSYGVSALAGGALCFGLRFMAIRHGWHLPVAHLSAQGRAGIDRSNEKKHDQGRKLLSQRVTWSLCIILPATSFAMRPGLAKTSHAIRKSQVGRAPQNDSLPGTASRGTGVGKCCRHTRAAAIAAGCGLVSASIWSNRIPAVLRR